MEEMEWRQKEALLCGLYVSRGREENKQYKTQNNIQKILKKRVLNDIAKSLG